MTAKNDAAKRGGRTIKGSHRRIGRKGEFSMRIWAALQIRMTGCKLRGVIGNARALALLVFATVAIAQTTASRATPTERPDSAAGTPAETGSATLISEKSPGIPPTVSYVGGQLTIDAINATLGAVLIEVGTLTGVKIDLPASANSVRMPVVKLGPGPARQVLASLLSGAHFDYLIQASDIDPEKIQSVLVMAAEKKGITREPFARAVDQSAKSESPSVPNNPDAAQLENAEAGDSFSNSQPASTQPDQLAASALAQSDQSNTLKPGTLNPPQVMSPQNISQQLQQMYQQRMQMIQQDRHTMPPAPVAGPGRS